MAAEGNAIRAVCLFCGANVGARPAYAAAARSLGALLAAERIALIYGGGSVGLMNEAADAALAGGGEVIGIITEELMAREVGHRGLSELMVVRTMHERKAAMAARCDAFVALPGGYGTFDEMCEMLTWNQLGIHAKPTVVVNADGYFDGFLAQLDRSVADRMLKPEHRALLAEVPRVEDVLAAARAWRPATTSKWYRDSAPRP